MTILVTGGAGYIGSHTVLSLLVENESVVVLDNLSNSSLNALHRVEVLTGKKIKFYHGDIIDRNILKNIFSENVISDVIHFAGLKSVGQSVQEPVSYYENNVSGSLVLIDEMLKYGIPHLIFSSSATVYGNPEKIPLCEDSKVGGTTNPYGTSKLMVEQIIQDVTQSNNLFRATILRYFNPVGAHPSGEIGESPDGIPNNLMPFICQVAVGKLSKLLIYGNDYATKDGTGVRDYIHVMDLAEGHVAAIRHAKEGPNLKKYNLGTGKGYSVLELINSFTQNTNIPIQYQFSERRAGDIAECWSNPSKAYRELGWEASRGLDEMVRDAWNWQSKNPEGFKR